MTTLLLSTMGKFFEQKFAKCSQMFVLICHCGDTCLIRVLHSNKTKQSKYQKQKQNKKKLAHCFFCLMAYTHKIQMCCTGMVSCLFLFMANMTHLHHFGFISMTITLYYICPGPVFQCGFNCDIYALIGLTYFGNFENQQVNICILHHFSMQIQL